MIKNYVDMYPEVIKCIDQKNRGLSGARNSGIDVAKGEYVTFLDSDDYVDNKMYKELLDKASKGDYDIVTCGVRMVYDNSSLDKDVGVGYDKDLLGKEEVKKAMAVFYPAACNKIYKKDVIGDLRFKEGIHYEDVEFMYRLLPRINNVGVVDGYYYYYLQREGSITYTYNDKLYDIVDNLNGIVKYYKKNKIYDEYKEEIEYVYVRYLYATFIRRLAKCKDKKRFSKGVDTVIKNVKETFPLYRKNKYLVGKKGLYLKYFNKFIANLVYAFDKNRMN
jgi:glycosyltransferase involved in cell wall biosynthesis